MGALYVRVDEETHAALRNTAQLRGITLSAAVRLFIERGMAPAPASSEEYHRGRADAFAEAMRMVREPS